MAKGKLRPNAGETQWFSSGGGGGGHGTAGATGGKISTYCAAGGLGQPSGASNLVPLRGGCQGGGVNDEVGPYFDGGQGGGAVQLSSRTLIAISGSIDVRGEDGGLEQYNQTNGIVVSGAGAGGGVLIEAPEVELGPNGRLLAPGGTGGSACAAPNGNCALGGAGATQGVPALAGGDIPNLGAGGVAVTAGGGGGGHGRIRINTPDQTYTKANTTVEDGVLSVGTLSTR